MAHQQFSGQFQSEVKLPQSCSQLERGGVIKNTHFELQNLTARRSPNSYMITNTRGKVGRFCLFKSAYKLGEDIVGTFDFSVGNVTCMQVGTYNYI